MKDLTFIIQVRTGSVRLPDKMLLPFYGGHSIPQLIIQRLLQSFGDHQMVVATTQNPKDDRLVDALQSFPVKIFRGSEDNVLDRFIRAGHQYGAGTFVRICADNPFLDMGLLEKLIGAFDPAFDYLSYSINGVPAMKTGLGFFAEMSKISVLEKVQQFTADKLYTEHVTNYIYESGKFNIHFLPAPPLIAENASIRLTVDTASDMETAASIYAAIVEQNMAINYKNVVEYIKKSNFSRSMAEQNEQNKK